MDLKGLRLELDCRAAAAVPFWNWDSFILGTSKTLEEARLPAGEVARREAERWRLGRFPSIQLAIADAAFSKVRGYATAVRNCIRPFAAVFAETTLREFAALEWPDVFERVFRGEPNADSRQTPHHLSNEGRIATTVAGSRALLSLGFENPAQVREALAEPDTEGRIRGALATVPGLGPALHAYTLMNLGRLTLKADRHVMRVLGPYLDLPPAASPLEYEERLNHVAPLVGRSPFEIDQLVWYTEAAGRTTERSSERALLGAPELVADVAMPASAELSTAGSGESVVATVVDLQPNKDVPVLELRFAKDAVGLLPSSNRGEIILKVGNSTWHGTIGLTSTNPPYVHSTLRGGGTERSMTELLRSLGVKEKGRLEFRCLRRCEFEFVRAVTPGQWRDGNDRGTRSLW